MGFPALEAVAGYLRCPVCGEPVRVSGAQLTCEQRHGFDIARQGYVSLLGGRGGPGTGDTSAMVAARERFLGGGHYRELAVALAELAAAHEPDGTGLVIDLAGGTGYYLAAVLDALTQRYGACLDLSAPALRRAARAHPRAAAIGADVWRSLPLAGRSAAVVLSVFGPRNAAETARVLTDGGALIIATPGAWHLRELREPLGMIGIEQRKPERLALEYRDFAESGAAELGFPLTLGHAEVAAVVAMGPSARHIPTDVLMERISVLPDPVIATVDLRIQVFTRIYESPESD
jgi:23S rRNA (guanine745-N1)-methyltransferase